MPSRNMHQIVAGTKLKGEATTVQQLLADKETSTDGVQEHLVLLAYQLWVSDNVRADGNPPLPAAQ